MAPHLGQYCPIWRGGSRPHFDSLWPHFKHLDRESAVVAYMIAKEGGLSCLRSFSPQKMQYSSVGSITAVMLLSSDVKSDVVVLTWQLEQILSGINTVINRPPLTHRGAARGSRGRTSSSSRGNGRWQRSSRPRCGSPRTAGRSPRPPVPSALSGCNRSPT